MEWTLNTIALHTKDPKDNWGLHLLSCGPANENRRVLEEAAKELTGSLDKCGLRYLPIILATPLRGIPLKRIVEIFKAQNLPGDPPIAEPKDGGTLLAKCYFTGAEHDELMAFH